MIENDTLDEKYVGGVYGFMRDWDNGSFCTDGIVSRISFFEERDAFCAWSSLKDRGLHVSERFAADVALFVDGSRAMSPCLWLETGWTFDGMSICWHTEVDPGKLAVPQYYREGASLAGYARLEKFEIKDRIALIDQLKGQGIYRDIESSRIIGGPLPLRRH